MKKSTKHGIQAVRWTALAVIVLCAGYLLYWFWGSRQHRSESIQTAEQYLISADDSSAYPDGSAAGSSGAAQEAASLRVDFSALQAVSDSVVGWIQVAGIDVIDYPVVYQDDEFFLNHSWNGHASKYGAIFMEEANTSDFSDYHTILYGHNMRDNSMFGALDQYADADFFAAHGGQITIGTPDGTRLYQIFSVEYIQAADPSVYTVGFSPSDEYTEFLTGLLSRSLYETGVTLTTGDRVLTLSTCSRSSGTRFVVHAKEITGD